GKDLARDIRIYDDGIDGDIREIAGLIQPGERPAVSCARHLENMAGGRWRIGIETTDRGITNWNVRGCDRWIECNAEHGAIRQNRVGARDIHPVRLRRGACSKIKTDLHIAIVGADDRDALKLR